MPKERSWPSAVCHTGELATEESMFTVFSTIGRNKNKNKENKINYKIKIKNKIRRSVNGKIFI